MTLAGDLRRHVAALEGERCPFTSPDAHRRAREYVAAQLGDAHRHAFEAEGARLENLVVERGEPRLIVGAHFDSVPGSPGADDDASGVAALIEIARAGRPGWYAAFDLEEMGMVGSSALCAELKRQRRRVDLMISLEMIGYVSRERRSQKYPPFVGLGRPDTGDFIALIANGRARRAMKRLRDCLERAGVRTETLVAPLGGWLVPAVRLSDHAPFWDAGYPAILVTDTSFLRNPHYHGPTDTADTLDYEFMAGVVRGMAEFLSDSELYPASSALSP